MKQKNSRSSSQCSSSKLTLSASSNLKQLRIAELFAGVGGFRIGLEQADKRLYRTVFSSQWEPGTKRQYASEIYVSRFGKDGHSNEDISNVPTASIPNHDLLVGGFPCQDYSVAKSLSQSSGIYGKKGVLWWEIHRILSEKGSRSRPRYLLLENVDRLLKSPVGQRGRDFAIMLSSLSDLGYAIEWRTINAADYGMPQRRRRVFFFGYHRSTALYKQLVKKCAVEDIIERHGILAEAFPCKSLAQGSIFNGATKIEGSLHDITLLFNKANHKSPFLNAGFMDNRVFCSSAVEPIYDGPIQTLKDIIVDEQNVPEEYFIKPQDLSKWMYLKGAKTLERKSKAGGHSYQYSEGGMAFPDSIDKPGRTIITGEGGMTPSRFKHVIETTSGRYRRLLPLELERMNMFPDNHTQGAPDIKRAFMMGNALVVGIVEKIGRTLKKRLKKACD
jgi:DNA (cytosine-5)-methyltransferase 1